MRTIQTLPKCVRKRTTCSTGKTENKDDPLISAARTNRFDVVQAIMTATPIPSHRHMPARQFPWAEAASAEGGNTQMRQTRTPMQNARERSSNHPGITCRMEIIGWRSFALSAVGVFDHRSEASVSFDCERVLSLRPVPVPCHDVPDHEIRAGRQLGQTHLKKSRVRRVYPTVALAYHPAVHVMDHDRRKGRLQIAVEPDADLRGWRGYRRADLRVRMVGKRVRPHSLRQAPEQHIEDDSYSGPEIRGSHRLKGESACRCSLERDHRHTDGSDPGPRRHSLNSNSRGPAQRCRAAQTCRPRRFPG